MNKHQRRIQSLLTQIKNSKDYRTCTADVLDTEKEIAEFEDYLYFSPKWSLLEEGHYETLDGKLAYYPSKVKSVKIAVPFLEVK